MRVLVVAFECGSVVDSVSADSLYIVWYQIIRLYGNAGGHSSHQGAIEAICNRNRMMSDLNVDN